VAGNRWLVIDGLVIAELGNLAYLCPEFLVVHFELVGANLWRIRVELEWPPVHLKLCLCVRRRGWGRGRRMPDMAFCDVNGQSLFQSQE
jgi:hypothetical protein